MDAINVRIDLDQTNEALNLSLFGLAQRVKLRAEPTNEDRFKHHYWSAVAAIRLEAA